MGKNKECPTCGEVFDTRHSLSVHHGLKHPDNWEDRFWWNIDIGETDECWPWLASCQGSGCGQFHSSPLSTISSHRIAFILEIGEPEDQVLHHCENRLCCNPNHLYEAEVDIEFQEQPDSCPVCGKRHWKLDFHHWLYAPYKRGCYLCRQCHDTIHNGRGHPSSYPWLKFAIQNLVNLHVKYHPNKKLPLEIVDRYNLPNDNYPGEKIVKWALDHAG